MEAARSSGRIDRVPFIQLLLDATGDLSRLQKDMIDRVDKGTVQVQSYEESAFADADAISEDDAVEMMDCPI